MAGDWIKWTKGFARKPEVVITARLLGIDLAHAAAMWMQLWEWADDQTVDGWIANVEPGDLDSIVGHEGFAVAGSDPRVGWLRFEAGGLMLPSFERHNGKSAKKRALAAERMRMLREQGRN